MIEQAGALSLSGPQVIVAHFSFDTAWIDPIPTGMDALLENLVEDALMQRFLLLRGE
jgi:hypothetical protein